MQKLAKLENKKREDYLRKLFYLMRLRPNIAKMLREKEKEDKIPFILDREIDPLYREGKQKAEKETKLAVAKNMLKQNLSVDTIVTVTGLSKEVVERLKKEEK
jgi:predicted transposase/invertase (TIGR01784 family)